MCGREGGIGVSVCRKSTLSEGIHTSYLGLFLWEGWASPFDFMYMYSFEFSTVNMNYFYNCLKYKGISYPSLFSSCY